MLSTKLKQNFEGSGRNRPITEHTTKTNHKLIYFGERGRGLKHT